MIIYIIITEGNNRYPVGYETECTVFYNQETADNFMSLYKDIKEIKATMFVKHLPELYMAQPYTPYKSDVIYNIDNSDIGFGGGTGGTSFVTGISDQESQGHYDRAESYVKPDEANCSVPDATGSGVGPDAFISVCGGEIRKDGSVDIIVRQDDRFFLLDYPHLEILETPGEKEGDPVQRALNITKPVSMADIKKYKIREFDPAKEEEGIKDEWLDYSFRTLATSLNENDRKASGIYSKK
jgi:hypothetical protein